jgi:hypothetical protein
MTRTYLGDLLDKSQLGDCDSIRGLDTLSDGMDAHSHQPHVIRLFQLSRRELGCTNRRRLNRSSFYLDIAQSPKSG